MKMNDWRTVFIIFLSWILTSCYLHPRGETQLAPALHLVYLHTSDPYGLLARQLTQSLKMSRATLTSSPQEATATINILHENHTQNLLSVSSTQQTRQYNLIVSVGFDITDSKGRALLPPQNLSESRVITIQSNQVLGSSNEKTLFYQQMQRAIAFAIINRISSRDVTRLLTKKPRK